MGEGSPTKIDYTPKKREFVPTYSKLSTGLDLVRTLSRCRDLRQKLVMDLTRKVLRIMSSELPPAHSEESLDCGRFQISLDWLVLAGLVGWLVGWLIG